MKQIYTEDDVIRYFYGEMDEEEYPVFFQTLCKDQDLWETYENFQSIQKELGEFKFEPSSGTCDRILKASHSTAQAMKPQELKSINKRKRHTLFSFLFASFLLIAGLTVWQGTSAFFPTVEASEWVNADSDSRWIYDRLYRMEDDRLLPEAVTSQEYRLVRFTGGEYVQNHFDIH
jgi:hypothetical protein